MNYFDIAIDVIRLKVLFDMHMILSKYRPGLVVTPTLSAVLQDERIMISFIQKVF